MERDQPGTQKKCSMRKGLVLRNAEVKLRIILRAAEYWVGCLHTIGLLFLPVPSFSSVVHRELLLIYASRKRGAPSLLGCFLLDTGVREVPARPNACFAGLHLGNHCN